MGKKHGVWFDLSNHLAIHKDVIQNKFSWLIRSGDTDYTIMKFHDKGHDKIKHSISFETINGYLVNITKETLISSHDPESAMTVDFSYNCLSLKGDYHLRYHSGHSPVYNPNAPWHDKPHRHEFDGNIQQIDIYSHDHRPAKDLLKKYTWKGYPVDLTFLGHENWHYVSQFLDEVAAL